MGLWVSQAEGRAAEVVSCGDSRGGHIWRVDYLFKLLGQRQVSHYSGDEEEEKRLADLNDSLYVD